MAIRDRPGIDEKQTAATRARYQRLALMYDRLEGLMEARYRPWRIALWQRVNG